MAVARWARLPPRVSWIRSDVSTVKAKLAARETEPAGLGPPAQADRIGGVGDAGEEHEAVAEIDVEAEQPPRIAMGSGERDADDGDGDADELQAFHPRAEQREVEGHDRGC